MVYITGFTTCFAARARAQSKIVNRKGIQRHADPRALPPRNAQMDLCNRFYGQQPEKTLRTAILSSLPGV